MVKTEATSGRSTFLALDDLLKTAARRCFEAGARLNVMAGQGSDPVYLAWAEIAAGEHRLANLLDEFTRNGPSNLLQTRFQYTPAAAEPADPDTPETPEEAVAQLVTFNHRLTEELRELALNIAPPELGEMLDELRREVESLGQSISMISVTVRDS